MPVRRNPHGRVRQRRIVALVAVLAASLTVVASPFVAAPAGAAEIYPVPSSGSWPVDGAGWGHGIGMSQWGTQGAAGQGLSHEQILGFYYPGTALGLIGQPQIRVQLTAYQGNAVVFGAFGSEQLVATDRASGSSMPLPPAQWYLSDLDANGMYLGAWTGNGWSRIATMSGPIDVTGPSGTWVYSPDLSGAGRQYWGTLRLLRTGTTTVQAVNVLDMDAYLKGAVPRESPSSWHAAALRAQSVAARSYARSVSTPAGQWDICDTTQCQVYGGRAVKAPGGAVTWLEAASTSAAVDATAGTVVAYNNAAAFTQYSSSNGGYSVAGSKPYLVAQPDPYSGSAPGDPVSRWRSQLSAATVGAHCPSGGSLSSFEILSRNGRGPFGGRITSVRVNCNTGSATLTGAGTLSFGMRSNMWLPAVPAGASPIGNVDVLSTGANSIRVAGWTLDPETANPIEAHVYIDSGGNNLGPANRSRPDVANAYPGYGDQHGFDATFTVNPGGHRVCVYGINVGAGANTQLLCRQVLVGVSPIGNVEVLSTGANSIRVAGWTLDPQTANPIDVHVYIDSGGNNLGPANLSRPDVGNVYPGYGNNHGFDRTFSVNAGGHRVCVYGINVGPGANTQLLCRQVIVGSNPIGNVEVLSTGANSIRVAGWTLDPDTANAIEAHVYIDGGGHNLGPANRSRPDVGAVYPGYGNAHGYDATFPVGSGAHNVCVFGINVGPGTHTQLLCRQVTVS